MPWLSRHWRTLVIPVCTVVIAVLLIHHAPGVNGPPYGFIHYREAPPAYQVFGLMALSALPLIAAIVLFERGRFRAGWLLPLLMLCVMSIKLTAASLNGTPGTLDFVPWHVQDKSA